AMLPSDLPRLNEIHASWQIVVAALGLSLATGVLIGLAPAYYATGADANRQLKEGGRSGTGAGTRQNRSRSLLVVSQIALSVVLLIGAGLLIRSFAIVLRQDPGLDPTNLVTGQIWIPVPNNPAANKYLDPTKQSALAQQLLERLSSLPGIEDAALGTPADVPMLAGTNNARPFTLPDESTTQQDDHAAKFGSVSPLYFDALKIPIVKGRVFTSYDNISAPKVAVVNEAFARKFSPRRDLVGRRLSGGRGNVVFEIVGIVANVRENGLDAEISPRVYFSILQRPTVALSVFLRSHGELQSTKDALARTVHEVDPDLPTFGVRTVREVMSASMARRRFSVSLMSAFALAAALLAALGIYGVMAFLVGQRGPEFGLRQALGATRADILRLAFRPGLVLAAQGTIIGLVVAFPATRLMASLLFGVSARDPITFIAVPVFLAVVASVACLAPARRATRVDPIVALRG
ncbi:MAG TPA: FtsX-like permease family protein, partial [Gemmatimonadaceae bacterium]|nr:FtsX-like permease family protein [Gemmatimonadaceae bacterium]